LSDTLTATELTPREIVRRTLDFDNPPRVARSFAPGDLVAAGPSIPNPEGAWRQIADGSWRMRDIWGNVWARLENHSKGEVHTGALADLADAATIPLPDFSSPQVYARAREVFASRPDHYHIGAVEGFAFSVARKMRRMEQYLMDLMVDPEALAVLHDRIDARIIQQIDGMAAAGADAVMIAEDWGTQTQLLVNPDLWRAEFRPRFARLCTRVHTAGLKMFMHSCGKMTAIIGDLIETGVDLLQIDQPTLHGIDTLAAFQEGAKITYWCPVDIQRTLQSRDEAAIRAGARELLDKLWRGRGGFIAGYYGDNASIGLEPQWQELACDEFARHGVAAKYR
ncbi:MAG: hypothetical protein M1457_00715, partial [bacterium]|nr:hypothetical protein [bacterium]